MRLVLALAFVLIGCDRVFGLGAVPDADLARLACPSGYATVGQRHYRISTHNLDWMGAEAECFADGMAFQTRTHLVVLAADEYADVDAFASGKAFWVGMNNIANQFDFKWVTDEAAPIPPPKLPPWGIDEPSFVSDRRCVERHTVNGVIGLADATCTDQKDFVCECDLFAEDPAQF